MLRRFSIRRKLFLVLAGTGLAALLLAGGAQQLYERITFKKQVVTQLEALNDMIAVSIYAAVDFDDPATARETLGALSGQPDLVSARLILLDGRTFATWTRPGVRLSPANVSPGDSAQFAADRVVIVRTLKRDGVPKARLVLESSFATQQRQFREMTRILALVGLVACGLSLLVAALLQRIFTAPLIKLTTAAESVHASGNFSVRADVKSGDEIGRLATSLNAMFAGIEDRDRRLAESHAFQRAIVEGSGVAVISTDVAGVVRGFNPAAERLLGYTAAEVIGQATPLLWHDPHEIAQRAAELTRELQTPVEPGFGIFVATVQHGPPESREWTYVRKEGSRVPVQLVISVLRDAAGATIGYCGVATDLTERKASEAAIRTSEERLRLIWETAAEAMRLIDADGRVVAVNSAYCRLVGLPREQLVKQPLENVLIENERANVRLRHQAQFRKRIATAHWKREFTLWDGRRLWIEGSNSFVESDPARPLLLGIFRDVTERETAVEAIRQLNADLERRVEERTAELNRRVAEVERLNAEQASLMEELRQSQRMADRSAASLQEANTNLLVANQELEAFAYSVSHDLRAPLRNITGFIELLRKRAADSLDAESNRFVATVVSETMRMGLLIDDLLTFARLGRAEMKLQTVHLTDLLDDVKLELQPDIDGRVIDWSIAPLPPVQGDRTLLRQVVANLISNAVKFTRHRSVARIEIGPSTLKPGDTSVTIYVRDNGAGFNPKYIHKLFGVFQRLHNSRDFEGTGIGLANVKRIVNRHGGRIWAEGAIDHGATFYFTLPLARRPDAPVPE